MKGPEKVKYCLYLLVVCVVVAIVPQALSLSINADMAGLLSALGALGAVIAFFATLIAIFDSNKGD